MLNTLTRVTLTAGLLILMVPRGVAAQSSGCETTQLRAVLYDTVSSGVMVGSSICRFRASVIDQTIQTCPGAAASVVVTNDSKYPVDTVAEGGNALCSFYKPLYTAWCHGGNPPDATTPSALTASLLPSGQVALAWRDNSSNCSCQGMYCPSSPLPAWQWFDIWRRTNTAGYGWIASVGASTTSYVDAGVPAGQQAYYVVSARHASYGFTATTSEAAATTTGGPSAAPAAPGGPTFSVEPGVVMIGWTDLSTDETGFRVERKTLFTPWTVVATLPANATSVIDGTVDAGTTYQYRVVAYSSGGASASGAVQVTTP